MKRDTVGNHAFPEKKKRLMGNVRNIIQIQRTQRKGVAASREMPSDCHFQSASFWRTIRKLLRSKRLESFGPKIGTPNGPKNIPSEAIMAKNLSFHMIPPSHAIFMDLC